MGFNVPLVDFCGKEVKSVFYVCLHVQNVSVTMNVQVVLMGIIIWSNRKNAILNVH